ncbi:MAG: hypothetical protein P4M15_05275 [Alphaproteobacteria bacterium]|nr:hypothetical protein [Alphaproteobacteria bacterium]
MGRLNDSFHVQRLLERSSRLPFHTEPDPFFRQRVLKNLPHIFAADSMGSAEFEAGTIPKVIDQMIARKSHLRAANIEICITPNYADIRTLELDLETAKAHASDKYADEVDQESLADAQAAYTQGTVSHKANIYIIASNNLMNYARGFIADEARQAHHLKQPAYLRESFVGPAYIKHLFPIRGWFELDNGFMFFTSWRMFDGMTKLLEIKHSIAQPVAIGDGPQRTQTMDKRAVGAPPLPQPEA